MVEEKQGPFATEKGKDSFQEFQSQALRRPRRGLYQQLIAGLLAKANSLSDSLRKIYTLCEAATLSRQKGKLDMDFVEAAYTVVTSFMNTEIGKEMVRVAWNFSLTKKNWNTYIRPWQKIGLRYYPGETLLCHKKYPLKTRYRYQMSIDQANVYLEEQEKKWQQVHEEILKMPPHETFYQKTGALSRQSFFQLRGEFEKWALINLAEVQDKIAQEIDPNVYTQMLQLMRKKEEEQRERPVESSMDSRE